MSDSRIKKFIPRELLQNSGSIKIIEPPKGVVSSKAAFELEYHIAMQTEVNNANLRNQFFQIKKQGEF